MKSLTDQFNLVALLLAALIFFQSCRVYKWRNVSLEEAVKKQKRVKIKTKQGKILKYRKIVFKEGGYFGLKKVKRKLIKTPIDVDNILKLRLHDEFLSIVYGIGIAWAVAVILVVGIALHNLNLDFGGNLMFPN